MDRHFRVFERDAQEGFFQKEEMRWFFESIQPIVVAVILFLVMYRLENIAIGRFARSKGFSQGRLDENEVKWLTSEEGIFFFMAEHMRTINFLREKFSEEELMSARIAAEIILFHEKNHCEFVRSRRGCEPTEDDLMNDRAYNTRLSFRLLCLVYEKEILRKKITERLPEMLST